MTAERLEAGQTGPEEGFSSTDLRSVLGTFATGVTVITSRSAEHAYGMTANAFTSVSLDPPLVLVCVNSGTTGSETIERNGMFAINILGKHQESISHYFATQDRPRGSEAFGEIPHVSAVTGCPILEGGAGYLDCRLVASHEAGDHVIHIGEVLAVGIDEDVAPLLFHRGRYCKVVHGES